MSLVSYSDLVLVLQDCGVEVDQSSIVAGFEPVPWE
jgi:hypothetical protein